MYKIDRNLYEVFIIKMLVDQWHSTDLKDLDKVEWMSYFKYYRDCKLEAITDKRRNTLEDLWVDTSLFIKKVS